LGKALWLVDPELRDGSAQNQQRDDKILGRFRLLAAEDEKSEACRECRKDHDLGIRSVFQIARQLASGPATPGFSRSKTAFDKPSASKKIEHQIPYLRDAGAGERCC